MAGASERPDADSQPDRVGLADARIEGAEFVTEGPVKRVGQDPSAPDEFGETEIGAKG